MKRVGESLAFFFIVGTDERVHASAEDVPRGRRFFAACGWPQSVRAPRMKADGTPDEKLCPHCIVQAS